MNYKNQFPSLETIDELTKLVRGKTKHKPDIGLILGSGLGALAENVKNADNIPYTDLPGWPVSTVEGHTGQLVIGELEGKTVLVMQGRIHFYEGYDMPLLGVPIRVMKRMCIEVLIVTNAAGGINQDFNPGDLMLITDHLNLIGMAGQNPLRGPNLDEFGPRFPDMSRPYSGFLNDKLVQIAKKNHIILHKGIYIAVTGPNLETRAEYRMFCNYADAVGMSTVPEVIVANHMGLPCAAISVLTDECDPDNLQPADINDIIETAGKAEVNLNVLFRELIREL